MNSLRIDFMEDQRWRYTWIATGVALALMLIVHQVLASKSIVQQDELRQDLDNLQSRSSAKIAAHPQDRRHVHALAMAGLLQTDLNPIFQTLETLKEPGIRLRQLQIDNTSRQVRIEYEFGQLEKITTISEHLNAGYSNRPWKFEGVNANVEAARTQIMQRDQPLTRGVWSCQSNLL